MLTPFISIILISNLKNLRVMKFSIFWRKTKRKTLKSSCTWSQASIIESSMYVSFIRNFLTRYLLSATRRLSRNFKFSLYILLFFNILTHVERVGPILISKGTSQHGLIKFLGRFYPLLVQEPFIHNILIWFCQKITPWGHFCHPFAQFWHI